MTERVSVRWDQTCTILAASVPIVILGMFLPPDFKVVFAAGWVMLTLIAALYSPPAGLFCLLVSIFESSLLFSAAGKEGNWGKFCALALLVGVVLHRPRHGQPALRIPREIWLFVLIAVAMLITTLYNGVTANATRYLAWVITPIMFLAIYNCIASYQEVYTTMVGIVALGQTVMALAMLTGSFPLGRGENLVGELGDANTLGMFLVFLLPYAFYIFLLEKDRRLKLWALGTVLMSVAVLVWTASRAAVFGLVTVGALLAIAMRPPRKQLVAILLLGILSVAVLPAVARQRAWERFTGQDPTAAVSYQIRQYLLRDGMRWFRASPLFGHGWKKSRTLLAIGNPLVVGTSEVNAHNVYLQVVLELGLLGAVPFVALILAAIARSASIVRAVPKADWVPDKRLGWCLIAGVGALVVCSFFLGNFESRVWYLALGVAIATAEAVRLPSRAHRALPGVAPAELVPDTLSQSRKTCPGP